MLYMKTHVQPLLVVTGSNQTGCSVCPLAVLIPAGERPESACLPTDWGRASSGKTVTPSTIPCPLDSHFQEHLHQTQSLLPTLPFTMAGTEENLWNSPLPNASGPWLCTLGEPGKEPFSRLFPDWSIPAMLCGVRTRREEKALLEHWTLTALFLVLTPQKAHRPGG